MDERRRFVADSMRDQLRRQGGVWVRARGRSMAPVLRLGDRVRLDPVDPAAVRPGELVAFVGEDGVLRTHRALRYVGMEDGPRLVARGDNERGADPPTPLWAVVGRVGARERFGVVRRTEGTLWGLYEPLARAAAAVKVGLRRLRRRRERRRPDRVKDRLSDVLLEGARLHPALGVEAWRGLGGEDTRHLSWLLGRHRLAARLGELIGEHTPQWASAEIDRGAARWRAACVSSLLGVDAALEAMSAVVGRTRGGAGACTAGRPEVPELLVLKGPAHAELLYGGSCRRPFTDLDVAVRPGAVDACREALCARGWQYRPRRRFAWQRAHREHNFFPGEPPAYLKVELHTGLVDKPEFVPVLARHPGRLWDEAVPGEVGGHPCLVLSAEAMVLHTAIHWHLHSYSGLLWGLDVALAAAGRAGKPDWARVVTLAQRWGVVRIAWVALTLAALEHDAPIPPTVLHRLRPMDPVARWLVRRLAGRNPVFRKERRVSIEQVLILTLRDSPWRRAGALGLLPLRVLGWEREEGAAEGAMEG